MILTPLDIKGRSYRKTPNGNPPHKATVSSKSQGFEDVRPTTDATVNSNLDPAFGSFGTFGQHVDCRSGAIQLSPTVIGNNDSIEPVFNSK